MKINCLWHREFTIQNFWIRTHHRSSPLLAIAHLLTSLGRQIKKSYEGQKPTMSMVFLNHESQPSSPWKPLCSVICQANGSLLSGESVNLRDRSSVQKRLCPVCKLRTRLDPSHFCLTSTTRKHSQHIHTRFHTLMNRLTQHRLSQKLENSVPSSPLNLAINKPLSNFQINIRLHRSNYGATLPEGRATEADIARACAAEAAFSQVKGVCRA